jgi:hypothetical protein
MACTDFTLDMLIEQFGLQIQEDSAFLDEFTPVPISPLLRQELEENVPLVGILVGMVKAAAGRTVGMRME